MAGLPLLRLARWRVDPLGFAEELRVACHHFGFFQLEHGLPSSLVRRTLAEARRFFELPPAEKRRIDYARSSAFRGYMASGVENTAGKPDRREQLEVAPDGLAACPGAWPPYERLRGPNQWPACQPELEAAVSEFAEGMLSASVDLTRALCVGLGLKETALNALFAGAPHWQLKLAAYSPASGGGAAQGVGAHTDSGFLTLVLQDDVGGLQAFTRGEWTNVPPLGPEVVVCNLGEVAELASRGYLLATPHRVLAPARPRLSVPFFYNPSLDAVVEPLDLPEALPWERAHYATDRHWRRPYNAMLPEYGVNAFKSLARSHPAVFATHHPDLQVLEDGQVVGRTEVHE